MVHVQNHTNDQRPFAGNQVTQSACRAAADGHDTENNSIRCVDEEGCGLSTGTEAVGGTPHARLRERHEPQDDDLEEDRSIKSLEV